MSKIEKLLIKFLRNPISVRYLDLERILLYLGFIKIEAKGSHIKFKHHFLEKDLIIPVHNGDCKNFYKEYAAKIIKQFIL